MQLTENCAYQEKLLKRNFHVGSSFTLELAALVNLDLQSSMLEEEIHGQSS